MSIIYNKTSNFSLPSFDSPFSLPLHSQLKIMGIALASLALLASACYLLYLKIGVGGLSDRKIELKEKDLIKEEENLNSIHTIENSRGKKWQLTGLQKDLLMKHSAPFHDFWTKKSEDKTNLIEDQDEFELLETLLKSLTDPEVLKEEELCLLAVASFKFKLNEKEIHERLKKFLLASFVKNDQPNIKKLLSCFNLYKIPLTFEINYSLNDWLKSSIGTNTNGTIRIHDFFTKIDLLKNYSLPSLSLNLSATEVMYPEIQYISLHLPFLSDLKLMSCKFIGDEDIKALKNLTHLETLNLHYCNNLTNKGLEYLKDFSKLKSLDLSGCEHITDEGLEHLKDLTQLEELSLYACGKITNKGLEHLKHLTQLKELSLFYCKEITDKGLEYLRDLTQLQSLDLRYCDKVTDNGLEHLKGLIKLKKLCLKECNQITDKGLQHLKGLLQLQELNLASCKVTSKGAKDLENLISNLKILHF